jgi:hypothetical protein
MSEGDLRGMLEVIAYFLISKLGQARSQATDVWAQRSNEVPLG